MTNVSPIKQAYDCVAQEQRKVATITAAREELDRKATLLRATVTREAGAASRERIDALIGGAPPNGAAERLRAANAELEQVSADLALLTEEAHRAPRRLAEAKASLKQTFESYFGEIAGKKSTALRSEVHSRVIEVFVARSADPNWLLEEHAASAMGSAIWSQVLLDIFPEPDRAEIHAITEQFKRQHGLPALEKALAA